MVQIDVLSKTRPQVVVTKWMNTNRTFRGLQFKSLDFRGCFEDSEILGHELQEQGFVVWCGAGPPPILGGVSAKPLGTLPVATVGVPGTHLSLVAHA